MQSLASRFRNLQDILSEINQTSNRPSGEDIGTGEYFIEVS